MATVLNTDSVPFLPGCTQATLSLASDSAGTLTLRFLDAAPPWAVYDEPVHLYHCGRLLFAGKVKQVSDTNSGGEKGAEVTVVDWRWLYEQRTFAAILAEEQESLGTDESGGGGVLRLPVGSVDLTGYKRVMGAATTSAGRSWHSLASHCSITAPGWAAASDTLTLDPSRSALSFSARDYSECKRPISVWTVVADMRASNPDCSFRPDYTTGTLHVISYSLADHITWSAEEMTIQGLESITPMRDRLIDGVAVFVRYPSGDKGAERLIKRTYPDAIDPLATNVPTFTSSADKASRASVQATHLLRQATRYFHAVNTLVYSGSITVRTAQVVESMVARRLSVTGGGTRPEWHSMGTIVTAEEWDFLSGTVTLTLGRDFDDPTLHELSWDPDAESDGGDDGGDDPDNPGGSPPGEDEDPLGLVARFEEGTPEADPQDASTYYYPLRLVCEDNGRDISTVAHYTLSILTGLEGHPELNDVYLVDPPGREVTLRLVRGREHLVELAATWDARGLSTDPDNPYQGTLRWGEDPDEPDGPDKPDTDDGAELAVTLSPATLDGRSLKVSATVTKNGAPYTRVHYLWSVSTPAAIPSGYKPSAELQADYYVEAGSEAARQVVTYALTVTDRDSSASAYAAGSYTPPAPQGPFRAEIVSASCTRISTERYHITAEARVYQGSIDVSAYFAFNWIDENFKELYMESATGAKLDMYVTLNSWITGPLNTTKLSLNAAMGEAWGPPYASTEKTLSIISTGGGDSSPPTDAQKRYNLFIYTVAAGYDFGYSSYPYLNPSVFPDWLWEDPSPEAINRRLLSEKERG